MSKEAHVEGIDWRLWVSLAALVVSIIVLLINVKFWKEANRPIVVARTIPLKSKSMEVKLLLINSGNRPAKKVVLSPLSREDLKKRYSDQDFPTREQELKSVESCFSSTVATIPNGETLSAPFGSVTQSDTPGIWKDDPTWLEVRIEYYDVDGRKFKDDQPLRIASIDSFGATVYRENPPQQEQETIIFGNNIG